MRQFLSIIGALSLLMYIGFAIQHNDGLPTLQAETTSFGHLQEAMVAMNATTTQVSITGWAPTPRPDAKEQARKALGWTTAEAPKGEQRVIQTVKRGGLTYITIQWVLVKPAESTWVEGGRQVQAALAKVGTDVHVTVQVEGTTPELGLLALGQKAMDRLHGTDQQPWSEGVAASVAARTDRLPASPFGINVQVALRTDPTGAFTHVWVAWPVLQQEY
jgi:hypothetical protein